MRPLQGLVCGEMRVCGAGCCGKWKNENSVDQRLGPWSQVVKMGHTSPLPIGDNSISGMEAPIASQMQCVMLCKVVTISTVSQLFTTFEAYIHLVRCLGRMLEAMKGSHQQRLLLSLRLWWHPVLEKTKFEGKIQNSKTKRTIIVMKNVELMSHSK